MSDDYRAYYDLESYLFETVGPRFGEEGVLEAFDLLCVIIWKANRSKSRFARRLAPPGGARSIEEGARELTRGVHTQPGARERLEYLLGHWGLRLPTATAILTVLYPEEFTVYDTRVCGQLERFGNLQDMAVSDALWEGYQAFVQAVKDAVPGDLSLRDKDRYLWGKSFCDGLRNDIETGFNAQQATRAGGGDNGGPQTQNESLP